MYILAFVIGSGLYIYVRNVLSKIAEINNEYTDL